MSMEKVEAQRNFVNKLWNISRFIITTYELQPTDEVLRIEGSDMTAADEWILGRLDSIVKGVTSDIEAYAFSQAGEKLMDFTWNDFADWYIEINKFEKSADKKAISTHILRTILKLWHPFIPFVTEVIWKRFNSSLLMVEPWPKAGAGVSGGDDFALVKEVVTAIRNARAENKVEPAKKVDAVIYAGKNAENLKANEILVKSLKTGIGDLEIKEKGEKIDGAICAVVGDIEIYLVGAVDAEKEKVRLEKEIANLEKFVVALNGKLSNQEFVGKAPEKVVAAEKEKLAKAQAELAKFKEQLSGLN
jgi:valyl-tRNA synthetase